MQSAAIQAESMVFYTILQLYITLKKERGNAIRVRQFF
jgi:hypothetical protein